jgi:hypothetical protein
VTPFDGTVWRILFADQAENPLAPARAPEGRFHHNSEFAIYTSLTAEGAGVAIQRYLAVNDAPRMIVPLRVTATKVMDLRPAADDKTNTPATSVVWQSARALGRPAPTWHISDKARQQGAQGILYPSRSRPDLIHLVLLSGTAPGVLTQVGPTRPWP